MRDASAAEAGVRETLAAQVAAWNTGDVMGFLAGYMPTDRTTFLSGTTLVRGHAVIADRFRSHYSKETMGELRFEDLEVYPLPNGDSAYVVGRFRVSGANPQSGAFTLVFRRFGGRYLIVHDHTSAEPKEGPALP